MKTLFTIGVLTFILASCAFAASSHDIELAQRFLALQNYEKAAEVLEKAYAQDPSDPEVQKMLKETYLGLKKYDKLESLIQTMLLREPENAILWVELGTVLLAQNKPDDAWKAFGKATQIAPANQALVIQIHQALAIWGFIDKNIEFIEKSRKALKNKSLLALELARLYEIKGRFDDAVKEYTLYLTANPDRLGEVEHRINLGERTEEELKQLRKALDELLKTQIPKWQAWRLIALADQLLGNYDKAFDALKKAEEAQEERYRGRLVASFVEDMLRIGQHEFARKGAEYMITSTKGNYALTGRLYMAKALRGLGKFADAIARLDSLADAKNNAPLLEDAAMLKAQIYLDNMHDPDGAERAIEPLSTGANRMKNSQALALKGRILIYRREFDEAKQFLDRALQSNAANQDVAYLLGMTFFFAGSYDTANVVLHNVVSRFPKSAMGNESVELLLIMQIAPDDAAKISAPLFLMFTHDTASARAKWKTLADSADASKIGDYILWKLALCEIALGDTTALATLRRLTDKHKDGFYAPLALEKLGDSELAKGNNAAATEIYARIMNQYPAAVNMEAIREKLRSLGGNM